MYKRQDLQTQGYSPEEAEAMIQESITATGKERVGMQSQERLYGYQNSNTAKRQEAANNGVRFMRDRKTISTSDPNASHYIPGSSLFGSKATDTSGIPINGSGTIPTNGDVTDVVFNKYYKIESKNSDNSKGGQLQEGNFVGKAAHAANVQGFVFEGTNELAQFGKGSPSDAGKLIEQGSLPKLDDSGNYYVTNKEKGKVYLKPKNLKQYVDENGDMYFVPMDRQEEIRAMGSDAAVNENPIELGAPHSRGDRFVDVDQQYVDTKVTEISYHPTQWKKAAQKASAIIGNAATASNDPDIQLLDNQLDNLIVNKPDRVLAFLSGKLKKETKNINGEQVVSKKGAFIGQVINSIINEYEDDNLRKQIPKETVTTNIMDRDSNGFSGFNQED